jgi:Flp pilus assembly protein TadG
VAYWQTTNRLKRDKSGVAAVELALAFPVIAALLFGGLDIARQSYMQAVLYGAVQKAGRDSTLQTASTNATTIDERVSTVVKELARHGQVSVDRKSYATFARAGQPEKFTDGNGNNTRDPLECFEDANANGVWDAAGGRTGVGGSDEIVVYTFTLTYERGFAVALLGLGPTQTIQSTTVLRNQPYANQAVAIPAAICT